MGSMSTTITPPSAPMTDVNSMLAGIGNDFFAGADSIPVPVSDPDTGSDTPVETPVETAETDTAAETPVETQADDAAPDYTGDAPAADLVPEGAEPVEDGTIKTKDSKGKYKYQLEEARYRTVYGNHQLAQQAAELLHEPLTLDTIKLHHDAFQANERLFDHVTSGDPARQADVVNSLITEMQSALADGETGVDPTIPFAETVYSSLRDNAPDAYAHLRLQSARDLLSEMYEQAASSGNRNLFSAAQQMAITLAGVGPKPAGMTDAQYAAQVRQATENSQIPFHTLNEMSEIIRTEDPATALARENAELKARLNGKAGPSPTEQFATWNQTNQEAVNKSIFDDAVQPTLAPVADGWKDFPDDYQRLVVDPLNNEVTKALRSDQDLIRRTADLRNQAKRATSEAIRQQKGEEIRELYVNRARMAMEKAKGPILTSAANALKGLSVVNNQRRSAAQTRTTPSGTGAPVKTSVLPTDIAQFKGNMFDSKTAMKQALAALNSGR